MMLYQSIFAYLHYISIFGVISSLMVEAFLFNQYLDPRSIKQIRKADSIYGLSALMVLATGFTRVYFFGKGSDYYYSNDIFLTKLSLFIVVGLLSIYPTVVFLTWKKESNKEPLLLEVKQFKTIRRLIILELILVFFLPFLAALMARGIDL